MTQALVLLCSPRAGGVSDTAARLFAEGLTDAGARPRVLALREHAVKACTGCGACARPPHSCVLATGRGSGQGGDDAEALFAAIRETSLLLFASPIYFYHLPAHFKALVDRTQRFWERQRCGGPPPRGELRPALAVLTAGRLHGAQLFSGALRSLRLFLSPLDAALRETRLLRGVETVDDLTARPAVTAGLYAWGQDWGRACRSR